jgi:hypothetical protein
MDRRKLRILGMVTAAACVAGPVIFWVVQGAHDQRAIQGEWETVSVQGNGRSGDWRFSTNGYLDGPSGYRSLYSINPLFRTITWAEGKAHARYELDGNNLKIFSPDGDGPQTVWTLKKVRSY